MARSERPTDDKGKVKFRFVEFELEGLNSTIEESIKNIVHSMSRNSTMPSRTLVARQTTQTTLPLANGDGHADLDPEQEAALEGAMDEIEAGEPARPKTPRRYTVPSFLSDLDMDSGDMPFKTFAEQQAPKSDNRKYIMIAAWFKKYRSLDTVGPDHVYTCNQKMGWKTQKDVGQPFRYMKKKSYFELAGRGQWRITHIGLDQLSVAEEEHP
ncbi:MAG: hypothetical protein ACYCPO_01450 [Acidobacteriaceae bacterium]